jgi:hypothetical protein
MEDALDANGNDVTACIMMSKLDLATLRHYRSVADRAWNLAENLLKQGMFRIVPGNYTQIPADFMNLDQFSTHGQVIDAQDALRIGLNIEVLDRRSELWDAIWTLHPPADGPRSQTASSSNPTTFACRCDPSGCVVHRSDGDPAGHARS